VESKIITGLMLLFTLMLVAGVVWPVLHYGPRRMVARKAANIARHTAAIQALEVALGRTGNDPAQHSRLTSNLAWHRAALKALAPDAAAAHSPTSMPLAA
jgi:hypothetical protein